MDIPRAAEATAEASATQESRIGNGASGMRIAAIFAMSFALALLFITCGAVGAIAYHLRRAPEAFEDETGFHFSSPTGNLLPEKSDLPLDANAEIRAAQFKAQSHASRRRETRDSIGVAIPRVREAH